MASTTEIRRTAREAGLLYLAMSVFAMIGFYYLPTRFLVAGDAAATARNIVAGEGLYRASLLLDLVAMLLFVPLALALYRLFEDVDRSQARLMVALVGVGIAAVFASFALNLTPLVLLSGADQLSAFSGGQLEALAYASLLVLEEQGHMLTSIWGLWLLPFGLLTLKSGFLPRFLGVLLLLSGVAYAVTCVAAVGFPASSDTVTTIAYPFYFGELLVVLWLAFVGARPRLAP